MSWGDRVLFVIRIFSLGLGGFGERLNRPREIVMRLLGMLLALGILGTTVYFTPWFQKLLYPLPHKELIFKYAGQNNLDPYLVAAIIRNESKFLPNAQSEQGATGLMQLMPSTAQWIAQSMNWKDYKPECLYEPEANIRMGCWYLGSLKKEFKNQTPLMVAAYNGGRGNVREWLLTQQWSGEGDELERIPFAETRAYVKRVLHDQKQYQEIYQNP